MKRSSYFSCFLAGALMALSLNAQATTIDWNTWLTSSTGTLASFSGADATADSLYPSYTPTTTFADGSIVSNAPTSANGIMHLVGGSDATYTVTFFAPVVNPVMAIWSLGGGATSASFDFNATPTFVSGGPNDQYGGQAITVSGNEVSGIEGNGTVEFLGTFSEISWQNPSYENWFGFNVGAPVVAPVPEPGSMMLLGGGLLTMAIYFKRRKNA